MPIRKCMSKFGVIFSLVLTISTALVGCVGQAGPEPTATALIPSPTATEVPPSPTPEPTSGIVAVSFVDSGAVIHLIDPSTGSYSEFAQFTPNDPNVSLDRRVQERHGYVPIVIRALFSPSYEHAAASTRASDGTVHVGWIDRQGNFTDVSASVPAGSDFSPKVEHGSPMFGTDGSFYFASRASVGSGMLGAPTIMKTTTADPSRVVVAPNQDAIDGTYWVQSHGAIVGVNNGSDANFENVEVGQGGFRAQDWIDETTWLQVSVQEDMIYSDSISASEQRDTLYFPYGIELIPRRGITVWSPVASPDGKQVAFLSYYGIFQVSSSGGEPVKIPESSEGPWQEAFLIDWI